MKSISLWGFWVSFGFLLVEVGLTKSSMTPVGVIGSSISSINGVEFHEGFLSKSLNKSSLSKLDDVGLRLIGSYSSDWLSS